ncbi:MAG: hypothetical protein ACTHLJ_07875 [Angustibacter sp.]
MRLFLSWSRAVVSLVVMALLVSAVGASPALAERPKSQRLATSPR